MVYYGLLAAAVTMFSFQFLFNGIFEKEYGNGLRAMFVFSAGTSLAGLIVLLIVHEVVRQFAEPKIVGKSLGLHPIISLVLLYVGYSLFGFAGLLLTPVVGIVAGLLINKNDASKVG